MEIYIEKEFLDKFYVNYNGVSKGQKTLATIFEKYHELEVYIDASIENPKVLSELEENDFFSKLSVVKFPESIDNIKDHFFTYSNKQLTLILTDEPQEWCSKAENLGALCLNSHDYSDRIETILRDCHLKIDLSNSFNGWEVLKFCRSIPLSYITVNDKYILSDKDNQKIDKNIIKLLKELLFERKESVVIKIMTQDFNPPKYHTEDENIQLAEKRHSRIISALANYKKNVQTISNAHSRDYDLHDRTILTNFLMIDSGKGFNLLPHKPSNSQIIVDSIFSYYTYKRIKNHHRMHKYYLKKLKKLETVKFKSIPELD